VHFASLFGKLATDIFGVTLVVRVKTEFLEDTASKKETSAVSSRVIGQTNGETVAGELTGLGGTHDDITSQSGVCNLADNILVGETDD
jgi:hypothetical protein